MNDQDKASPGLAVGAGAIVLGAVPVFFALLETVPSETIGAHQVFRDLFSMAGTRGLIVGGAGLIATVLAALITGSSVRRASVPGALALAPLLLV